MYNEYFGFKESPFSIAPDPRYLFMSEQHREALAHLMYGLNSDGGFVLLTGEVGTGKTTVCRCLLEQVPDNFAIAFIFNPKLTVQELLATICDEFRIQYPEDTASIKVFIDLINAYLLDSHAKGRKAVLIIDEAQNLSADVLEQLRLLTNLETNQRKLLQIMLIGQPELRDKLSRPQLRQLSQRIIARYHLAALSQKDISAYVSHRLSVAGLQDQLFTDSVLNRLYRLSGGVPRLINVLCDRALLGAYVQNNNQVNTSTLTKAAHEVLGKSRVKKPRYGKMAAWIIASLLFMAGLVLSINYYEDISQKSLTHEDVNKKQRPEVNKAGDKNRESVVYEIVKPDIIDIIRSRNSDEPAEQYVSKNSEPEFQGPRKKWSLPYNADPDSVVP